MKWAIVVALVVGAALGYLFYFSDREVAPPAPPEPQVEAPQPAAVKIGTLNLVLGDDWQISTTTEASKIEIELEDPGARRDEVLAFVSRTLRAYEETVDPASMAAGDLSYIRESGRLYSLAVDGEGFAASNGRTSYKLAVYYDTGGAHPNGAISAEAYGPTGERLSLADVVGVDRTLDRVAEALRPRLVEAIDERMGGEETYEPDEDFEAGTDPVAENYANWYLSGSDLVVIVNPYQVGPYAFGSYEIAIPLAEI
jgi:hypothetical protein